MQANCLFLESEEYCHKERNIALVAVLAKASGRTSTESCNRELHLLNTWEAKPQRLVLILPLVFPIMKRKQESKQG